MKIWGKLCIHQWLPGQAVAGRQTCSAVAALHKLTTVLFNGS